MDIRDKLAEILTHEMEPELYRRSSHSKKFGRSHEPNSEWNDQVKLFAELAVFLPPPWTFQMAGKKGQRAKNIFEQNVIISAQSTTKISVCCCMRADKNVSDLLAFNLISLLRYYTTDWQQAKKLAAQNYKIIGFDTIQKMVTNLLRFWPVMSLCRFVLNLFSWIINYSGHYWPRLLPPFSSVEMV